MSLNKDFQILLEEMNVSDLSNQIISYPQETQDSLFKYLSNFSNTEKKAFLIAKNHLGTSFNIIKSTGYNDWLKKS